MLPSIDYATLLQYSPKGKTALCESSREVTANIKNGRLDAMRERVGMRITEHYDQLQPFLNKDITLVPVPRSSPIQESQLWPSLEIAHMLATFGLGTVAACLVRHTPVKKLALCINAHERPSVAEHFASFGVEGMVLSHQITLVDDILTQGRTGMAAASRLAERFPWRHHPPILPHAGQGAGQRD